MAAYAIPSHPIPGLESRPRLEDFDYGMFFPPPPALRRAHLVGVDGLADPPAAISLMTSHARVRAIASEEEEEEGTAPSTPREEVESRAVPRRPKGKTIKKAKKPVATALGAEGTGSESEQIFSIVPISTTGVYYARLTTILQHEELRALEESGPLEAAGPLIPSLSKSEVTISNTLGNLRAHASADIVQVWVLVVDADNGTKWVRAEQGFKYPSRTRGLQYFLSLRDPLRPSWVKKETLSQYDCPSKQRTPE